VNQAPQAKSAALDMTGCVCGLLGAWALQMWASSH